MTAAQNGKAARRNRGFEKTHRQIIEAAVRLVSEKGADALSVAAMAREMRISRASVYYHFDSREALLAAVRDWAAEKIAGGMDPDWPVKARTEELCRLAVENPEVIKLWIDDFLTGSDIRHAYPKWDSFVAGMRQRFDQNPPGTRIDAEVYCTIMLTTVFVASHVYARSVAPGASPESIVNRFVAEQARVLKRDGLDWEE